MKVKFTGEQDEITIRGRTFAQGKTVDLDPNDLDDRRLFEKIAALPYFEEVKARRKVKADDKDE